MKKIAFWVIAFLITASSAFFQRRIGPTSPVSGKISLNSSQVSYNLARSHDSTSDYELEVEVKDPEVTGGVTFRRYRISEPWTSVPLVRKNGQLTGSLPAQPPAGKLEYKVMLNFRGKEFPLTGKRAVVIRFRGHVPLPLLISHGFVMFLAMLFSTRAGIEALDREGKTQRFALWTLALLILGGIILGGLVQKLAFGQFWTGVPLGYDLTDNKTLIAVIGWMAAVVAGRRGRPARWWVLGASVLLLIVYFIPHSLFGSELDYSKAGTLSSPE
jgi:hypothetical protein